MDIQTQQQQVAAGAAYASRTPTEHALDSPANHSLRSRRRTSLPSSIKTSTLSLDTSARPKKRSPNYIHTQAASPEVISSLIDQLSAISASTQNHFENLSIGYEHNTSVPTGSSTHISTSSKTSVVVHDESGADNTSPYYSSIRDQNDLYPDDACEPPVVRTSKAPSGLSPVTALPKQRRDKTHSLSGYIGRSAGSSASIHSCHSARSSNSFGNISVEAGAPALKPVTTGGGGSNRSSAESKRSVKRSRSVMYMSSRERLKQKEADNRKRLEETASPDSPRKPASQLFSYEDTIKEEPVTRKEDESPVVAESSRLAQRYSGRNASPTRRIRMNWVDGPTGDNPIEQGLIPNRGSSLRHGSPSKKSRKSSSGKGKDKVQEKERPKSATSPMLKGFLQTKMDPEEARKQKLLMELEQEENEVAQRIKQLREQKLLRDKIAGKLPAADSATGAESVVVKPCDSVSPNPKASSNPAASSTSDEQAQDATKARKPLGISTLSTEKSSNENNLNKPLPSIRPREPTRPAPLPPSLRHSRHRSLTVNDGDDISLPINYTLALKSLDTSAPDSPRTPRIDSTHMTLPQSTNFGAAPAKETDSSRESLKRSNSLSVGGRPAFGRKANSAVMGAPKGHKHSASLTEERPPAFRSISEDVSSGRHSALSMASASNSFSLQQKRTLKKKRWSHPDLPAKAEKAHNDRVDAQEAAEARAAQQSVNSWGPVVEERPTSLDSVDMDVDAYLRAPRLSQKIRHPQTGRIISFSEVGDPNGYAIFVCVGMGLTRFVMAFYDQLAATLKLRLITPERPGVGGSQVDPNGTPLTWPGKCSVFHMLDEGRLTNCVQMTSSSYVKP